MAAPFPPSPRRPAISSHSPRISSPHTLTYSELQTFRRIFCSNERVAIAFAHYASSPVTSQVVVSERLTDQSCRWARLNEVDHVFKHPDLLQSYIRYGRTIAFFNLYPESQRDLHINHLLWRTAQTGEYSPSHGNMLLQNNVLSVTMPANFYSFLADVTEEQLNICTMEVLTLIAEEEDEEGFDLMQSELHQSVWHQLVEYISHQPKRQRTLEQITVSGVKLSAYVEMLIRLCYHSPWKIDVYAGYVTPRAIMSAVLAASAPNKRSCRQRIVAHHEYDRKLVRSVAKRPVSSPTLQLSSPSRIPSSFANRNTVFWKLFREWRCYRWMLVHLLGLHPRDATTTMVRSISHGTQEKVWKQVESVIHLFRESGCIVSESALLASIPEDVVSTKIAPFVLLNESNG